MAEADALIAKAQVSLENMEQWPKSEMMTREQCYQYIMAHATVAQAILTREMMEWDGYDEEDA
jgi:hypothetical protein